MNKKKILFFSANPFPGGAARIFVDLVNTLSDNQKEQQYEVIAAINKTNTVPIYNEITSAKIIFDVKSWMDIYRDKILYSNILLKIINKIKRIIMYYPVYIKNLKNFRRKLEADNIDCIIASNGGYPGDTLCLQLLRAAKKAGIKKRILLLHNYVGKRNILEKIYYYFYDKNIDNLCTDILTVSQYSKMMIEKNSLFNKKVKVIYNGLTYNNHVNLSKKKIILGINDTEQKIKIGMIGNFERRKGHMFFLKSLSELVKRGYSFQGVIIGNIFEKEYYDECLNFIEKHKLNTYVKIVEGIYDAGQYSECFDVVVFPSIAYESFGLISLECMMYGIPVIAFRQGGIPEVVEDSKTGFLVDIGEYKEIANKIEFLINKEDTRCEMGKCAYKAYRNNFTNQIMAKNYLKIIMHN